MKGFIKEILLKNGFKESYIESLIHDKDFLTEYDEDSYNTNKNKYYWKTVIFGRLNFKSFTKQSKNYWIFRGYSGLEARDLVKENKLTRKDPTPMQKEFWIQKGMSEDEAIFKIKSSRKTQPEYWIARGYSMEEAIEKIKDYQKINVKKLKDKKIKNPELFEDIGWNQKKYWTRKGLTEDEAIKKVSSLQSTFSLKKCIEKHGQEKGTEKWLDRQNRWKEKVYNEKTCISKGVSKMSLNFINELMGLIDFMGTFLYDKNEKFIYSKDIKRAFKYDFTYAEKRKIIEINGDFWHGNPDIFKDENAIHRISKKTFKDIKTLDEYKIKLANDYGYDVLTIWENDINKNKEEVFRICLNFLKS